MKLLPLAVIAIIIALLILLLGSKLISKNPMTSNLPTQSKPAELKTLRDGVVIERNEEKIKIATDSPSLLKEGDKVTTDISGIAVIKYDSGTEARLGPGTTVTYANSTSLFQDIGKVFVRFRKALGGEENFSVETSNLVATVRGTAFASIIKKGFDPKVLVQEDTVEVTAKDADGNKLEDSKETVNAGDEIVFSLLTKKLKKPVKQTLTQEEKDWLELNKNLDAGILSTPTPTPKISTSPKPSGSSSPSTAPVPVSSLNSMPGIGYSSGSVNTPVGTFVLSCIGTPKGTRVITDSANDNDCTNDCPVLPLDQFATRNGGFAAMNGMYFCPADYPACSDKKNSFDTLFFNSRLKKYINSANNVYSTLPFLVINGDGSPRFIGRTLEWGRDTGIQAGTAGNPMLVQGGNISVVEGNLDSKQRTVKSNRGAFVEAGANIYLCITRGATVPDSAQVYKTLGVNNAINIDGGGSSALWINGSYKYGPGRQIPTAIIFAR